MASIHASPLYHDLATKMAAYAEAEKNYRANSVVQDYENSKTMLQAATQNCFTAGVDIHHMIRIIQQDQSSNAKSIQSASLKVAKLYTTKIEAFLAEHGKLEKGEKKDKKTAEKSDKTFAERQKEKSWEPKVVDRQRALEQSGLAPVFYAPIPKTTPKTQPIQALYLNAFAQAYQDFTQSQVQLKSDDAASSLDKAYKKTRKGDPQLNPGFMATVGQNRKVIAEHWSELQPLFSNLNPIILAEVKQKLGIKA